MLNKKLFGCAICAQTMLFAVIFVLYNFVATHAKIDSADAFLDFHAAWTSYSSHLFLIYFANLSFVIVLYFSLFISNTQQLVRETKFLFTTRLFLSSFAVTAVWTLSYFFVDAFFCFTFLGAPISVLTDMRVLAGYLLTIPSIFFMYFFVGALFVLFYCLFLSKVKALLVAYPILPVIVMVAFRYHRFWTPIEMIRVFDDLYEGNFFLSIYLSSILKTIILIALAFIVSNLILRRKDILK